VLIRRADEDRELEAGLLAAGRALVNQENARIIVPAQRGAPGYWFGGGNMVALPDGRLCLVGRYRNAGDSRTGLDLGDRGKELALFVSADRGGSWRRLFGFEKQALVSQGPVAGAAVGLEGGPEGAACRARGADVLSIEGAALRVTRAGVELYVSSEKRIEYPEPVASYQKPGTGVWTIERLRADSLEALATAPVETLLESVDPRYLHVKDPFLYEADGGRLLMFFCHHPFSWSSSNTGVLALNAEGLPEAAPRLDLVPRGTAWDVAITRGTCLFDLPEAAGLLSRCGARSGSALGSGEWPRSGGAASGGARSGRNRVGLVFYDGGESLRNLAEHPSAVARPRGYSCEELGGLGMCFDGDPGSFERLSPLFPAFVSPWGTGSSRYVDVLRAGGSCYVTWQQAQADGSQPLVLNVLSEARLAELLR